MTDFLTLAALAELERKATEGPWFADEGKDYSVVWTSGIDYDPNDSTGETPIQVQVEVAHTGVSHADAEFIAAIRNLTPNLISEIQSWQWVNPYQSGGMGHIQNWLADPNNVFTPGYSMVSSLAREVEDVRTKMVEMQAELDSLKKAE